jgi:hypothetical protein
LKSTREKIKIELSKHRTISNYRLGDLIIKQTEMKNFRIIELEKLKDVSNFQLVEEGIYNDLNDDGGFATYRIAMAMDLENEEDSQYPLEDILDEYLVHVEEFLNNDENNSLKCVFGGELDDVQNFKSLVGKRVYNEKFVDEEGQTRVRLKIE